MSGASRPPLAGLGARTSGEGALWGLSPAGSVWPRTGPLPHGCGRPLLAPGLGGLFCLAEKLETGAGQVCSWPFGFGLCPMLERHSWERRLARARRKGSVLGDDGAQELGGSSVSGTGTWQTANCPQMLPPPTSAPSIPSGLCKADWGGWKRGGSRSLLCPSVGQWAAPPREDERPSWSHVMEVPGRTTQPSSRRWSAFSTADNLFLRGRKYINPYAKGGSAGLEQRSGLVATLRRLISCFGSDTWGWAGERRIFLRNRLLRDLLTNVRGARLIA